MTAVETGINGAASDAASVTDGYHGAFLGAAVVALAAAAVTRQVVKEWAVVRVAFEVEQAGCESCGKLITNSLSEIGTVESIDINEDADTATVVLSDSPSRDGVDAALAEASAGAGHGYRVRTGSWRPLD